MPCIVISHLNMASLVTGSVFESIKEYPVLNQGNYGNVFIVSSISIGILGCTYIVMNSCLFFVSFAILYIGFPSGYTNFLTS